MQPRADSRLFSIKLFLIERKSVWGSPEQILSAFQLKSKWKWKEIRPYQILIHFHLNCNWKWKEIRRRQPSPDSNRFSIKFYLKMKEFDRQCIKPCVFFVFSPISVKPCSKPCVLTVFLVFSDQTLLKTLCFNSFFSFFSFSKAMEQVVSIGLEKLKKLKKTVKTQGFVQCLIWKS